MKKLRLIILAFLAPACIVTAQQDPLTSQYMYGTLSFNPAAAGISGMVCATALSKQQWVGFEGAPVTTMFMVSTPFRFLKTRSGAGLLVESDKTGFNKDIRLSGIYSYIMDLGPGKLGIGLSLGMYNTTLSPEWVIPNGDAHTPASGDPLIPENKESFVAFDAGVGAYFRTDKYYAGVSITHLNEPKIKFTKGVPYLSRHYYFTAGYIMQLPNPSLELLPSVFAFSDGKAAQVTVNATVRYNKKVWGGLAYRAGDALIGMAGFELYNGLRVGYAYDFPLTDVRKSTSGSHEFMVNYCFDISLGKSPMKYKSIRFL